MANLILGRLREKAIVLARNHRLRRQKDGTILVLNTPDKEGPGTLVTEQDFKNRIRLIINKMILEKGKLKD